MTEWKLVPVEPTLQMEAAAGQREALGHTSWGDIYRAMLAAAPAAPAPDWPPNSAGTENQPTPDVDGIMSLADEYGDYRYDDTDSTATRAALRAAVEAVVRERDDILANFQRHIDLAPRRYAAAKATLPEVTRNMQCPFCDAEFADGALHDTGLALINTFDRAERAERALAEAQREAADLRLLAAQCLTLDEIPFDLRQQIKAAMGREHG